MAIIILKRPINETKIKNNYKHDTKKKNKMKFHLQIVVPVAAWLIK